MSRIAFRALAEEDLATLFGWLGRPHVRRRYAPAPANFAEFRARYGPRTGEDCVVKAFVVEVEGADAGYIQTYPLDEFPDYEARIGCEKGAVGVDLFLADEWRTGRGLGPQVIRRFADEWVFGRYGAAACIAGPLEGDTVAIRAFEKAGFRRLKTVENERGERECVLRLVPETLDYRVETIQLLDEDACVAFHRDMYAASFGSLEGFAEEMGPDNQRYLADLRGKIAQVPEGNVHLWHGERIVGQLEMRLLDAEPHVGYVSFIYVLPELRGHGLGRMLHEHAAEVSRRRDKRLMRLSVSLTNVPAILFYRKLGWTVAGSRPNKQPMAIMEFRLEA